MYLVDTSAWIDFLKKKDDRLGPYLESREAALSDIVLFELLSGVPPDKEPALLDDLALFDCLPLTRSAARIAAPMAHAMRRRGFSPQTTDLLIAGIALEANATLIHKDRDFEDIRRFSSLKTVSFLK